MNRKRLISIVGTAVSYLHLGHWSHGAIHHAGRRKRRPSRGSEGHFGDGELLAENLGRPVNIRYYEDYASMRRGLRVGLAGIFLHCV